jgi:hypothetical protein
MASEVDGDDPVPAVDKQASQAVPAAMIRHDAVDH